MVWKLALSTLSLAAAAHAVTTNYTTNTNPLNISIPDIPQTTSTDPTTQCTYYNSPYTINQAEWPTIWATATSNGMNASAEFKALYDSIDWSGVPNIPVRKLTPEGGLDMSGYDTVNDPDCWWSSSQCTTPKKANINADIRACQEPDVWGLTFDDGPNCSHNAFYNFLQDNSQKASMFYIGSNVISWPYGALRGIKDGHHIAGHTWSHKMMTTLTNQEVLAELYYTQKAIKYVTGVTPKYWRPAQGDLDDRVRWIATQLNLTAIIWNLDTNDWAAGVLPGITVETVNSLYEQFIEMGKNGTFKDSGNIVLSHEINNQTMEFFMKHYSDIKKSYSHVLDVATCMNISNPYVEDNVIFKTFDQIVNNSTTTNNSSHTTSNDAHASYTSDSSSVYKSFNSAAFIAVLFGLLVLA